jgi:hypothetical protein
MAGNVLSEGFTGSFVGLSGSTPITATRPDIIRSLLTVGYPSRRAALRLVGRWREKLLTAMATGYLDRQLSTTKYFHNLEQSEKVGITFLLAEAFTHWYAQTNMQIEYLVHVAGLSTCSWVTAAAPLPAKRNAAPPAEKSRPDFIGIRQTENHVFESKGRIRKPSAASIGKALGQVSKLHSINGSPPTTRCASFFMFKQTGAEGRVVDPAGAVPNVDVTFDKRDALAKAYSFFLDDGTRDLSDQVGDGFVGREIDNDLFFAIDKRLLPLIQRRPTDPDDRQQRTNEIFAIIEDEKQSYEGRRTKEASPGPDGTLLLDRRG